VTGTDADGVQRGPVEQRRLVQVGDRVGTRDGGRAHPKNCEHIIRFFGPLLISPSGPVPLPRALGLSPQASLPPLLPPATTS
jgi:hypothetical protein